MKNVNSGFYERWLLEVLIVCLVQETFVENLLCRVFHLNSRSKLRIGVSFRSSVRDFTDLVLWCESWEGSSIQIPLDLLFYADCLVADVQTSSLVKTGSNLGHFEVFFLKIEFGKIFEVWGVDSAEKRVFLVNSRQRWKSLIKSSDLS